MDILKLIKSRRSVRRFKKEGIPPKAIGKILEAGRFAPSGLNNQPWRFMVLRQDQKDALAGYTKYSHIVKSADTVILVFLDRKSSYHDEKDLLAVGACVQNMLLYIHGIGLGACWLGEILHRRGEINSMFTLSDDLRLEAVIALGVSAAFPKAGRRKKIDDLMVG